MKRRNFLALGIAAAAVAVLPKQKPDIEFPMKPDPTDGQTLVGIDWGAEQDTTAVTIFNPSGQKVGDFTWYETPLSESSFDLPLDTIYFVKRNA